MSCVYSKTNNCVIFWDYNPELSIEYLNNVTDLECISKSNNYIRIDFSEFKSFDVNSKTFGLKSEMNDKILLDFEEQYKKSKNGLLFFSIIVNNKIIFNGLNRISMEFLLPTNYYKIDEKEYLIIYTIKKKYLRISNIFCYDDIFDNKCLNSEQLETINNCFKNLSPHQF